jgi:hypothetical protein
LFPFRFLCVRIGSSFEERVHRVNLAGLGGQVNRPDAADRRFRIYVRACVEQQFDDCRAARFTRDVQRSVFVQPSLGADVGAGIQQHLGHLSIAECRCIVQSRHAIAQRDVDVRTFLQQSFNGFAVTSHRRLGDLRVSRRSDDRRAEAKNGKEAHDQKQCFLHFYNPPYSLTEP